MKLNQLEQGNKLITIEYYVLNTRLHTHTHTTYIFYLLHSDLITHGVI